MKKIYKSKNGFTLVELLAVIVIIGILMGVSVMAVMRFIDRARQEQVDSQEKTLAMAAESYLQDNRGLLPKSIGETTQVSADTLMKNKYLTEEIKNAKKESCMENSYVTAKKETQTKYAYAAHIYCGNDKNPDVTVASKPTITISFDTEALTKFNIIFKGGVNGDKDVAIDGYGYSILTRECSGCELKEVYSSGTLNANNATTIVVDRNNDLRDYVDLTVETTVAVKAVVRNVDGATSDMIKYAIGGEGEVHNFKDNTPPICVAGSTSGEATNKWINVNTPVDEVRRIRVVCSDGKGSGCVRPEFTKTWDGTEPVENGYIEIKDNAGNSTQCPVKVLADRIRPIITLDAYAKKANDEPKGNSILAGIKTTEDSSDGIATINNYEYENLYNGYMNKAKYPNGVIYKVELNDSIGIKQWKWEVNEGLIDSTTNYSKYENVSLSKWNLPEEDDNGNVTYTEVTEAKSHVCGKNDSECSSFYIKLYYNGLRKGVLTVEDKAGNEAKYVIYANIQREAPKLSEIINSSSDDRTGAWTNSSVTLKLSHRNGKMPFDGYYYSYNIDADEFGLDDEDAATKWVQLYGDTGEDGKFVTEPWVDEINKKIYIVACDVAQNCSDVDEDTSSTKIQIDKTAPTGLTLVGYKKVDATNITSPDGVDNLDTIESDTWHKGWVVIIPSGAKDTGGSGGIKYELKVTGKSENTSDEYQDYRNVNAEGISTVSFRACDKVGNCADDFEDFIVKLDRTAPLPPTIVNSNAENNANRFTKSDVTLTIGSVDPNSVDGNSGIGKYYYSYSDSPSGTGDNPETEWVEMPEGEEEDSFDRTWDSDVNATVYIKVCDQVKNCNKNQSIVKIDRTAPTTPEIINPNGTKWTNKSFSLTLKSSDGNGSGLADYQYTYNANASEVGEDHDTNWKSYGALATETFETTPFSGERNQDVYVRVCDAMGNCSAKNSNRIKIDKTDPTCGNITATTDNSETGVSGSIACLDDDSKCVNNSYSFGPLIKVSSVEIKDNAGNKKDCSIPVVDEDCSIYTPFQFHSLYNSSSNNCPSDEVGWDYEFGKCSDNFNPDNVCASQCAQYCASDPNCRKKICCVKRRRSGKICYKIGT